MFTVGDYIYIQYKYNYDNDDSTHEYAYRDERGNKFNLSTIPFNYVTGKIKEIDFPYYIDGCTELCNAKGIYNLAQITLESCKKDELISYQTVIVDENLVIHDDVTGESVISWIKVGDNKFHKESGRILTQEGKFVAIIEDSKNFLLSVNPTINIENLLVKWNELITIQKNEGNIPLFKLLRIQKKYKICYNGYIKFFTIYKKIEQKLKTLLK